MDIYQSFGGLKLIEKQLRAGQIFGEVAVLYNCPRTATIKSVTRMLLWTIKRGDFKRVLSEVGSESLAKKGVQQIVIIEI